MKILGPVMPFVPFINSIFLSKIFKNRENIKFTFLSSFALALAGLLPHPLIDGLFLLTMDRHVVIQNRYFYSSFSEFLFLSINIKGRIHKKTSHRV
jgi:hypothetical protein